MSNVNSVNVFDSIKAFVSQFPLVKYTVGFLIALAAYAAGLLLIDNVMDTRLPLVAFAIFFLPAVLRAWLLVYWEVKKDFQESVSEDKEVA